MSNKKIFEEIQYYLQDKTWEKAFQSTLKLESINEKFGPGDRTPLLYFTYFQAPVEYIEKLLQNGADVNAVDNKNNNAVFHALFMDKVEYIEILAKYGANLEHRKLLGSTWPDLNEEEKKELGHTALCYELEKNCRIEHVEALLQNGADVNNPIIDKWLDGTKNKTHRIRPPLSVLLNTQLHKSLYLPLVELLIKYGANINKRESIKKDSNNKLRWIAAVEDPLERAASLGLYDVSKLLIEKHIECNTFSKNKSFIWKAQIIAKDAKHYLIYNLIKDTIERYKKENNLFPYNVTNFFGKVFRGNNITKHFSKSEELIEQTKNDDDNEIEKLRILIESSSDVAEYQYVLDIFENIDIEIDRVVSSGNVDSEVLKTLAELLFVLEQKCYNETLWSQASFFYQQPIEYRNYKNLAFSGCPIDDIEIIGLGGVGEGCVNPIEFGLTKNIYTYNQMYFLFAAFLTKPSKKALDDLVNTIDAVNKLMTHRFPLLFEMGNTNSNLFSNDELKKINNLLDSLIRDNALALLEICSHIKKSNQFSKLSLEMMFNKENGSFKDSFMVEFELKYPQILNKLLEFIEQYKFICNENNKTERIEQIFEKLFQYSIKSSISTKQDKLDCVYFILDNIKKGDFLDFLKRKRSNFTIQDMDYLSDEEFEDTRKGSLSELLTIKLKNTYNHW